MAALSRVIFQLLLQTDNLTSGLKNVEGQFKQLERSFELTGTIIGGIGDKMTKAITLPLVGAAGASLVFAQDFQQSMNQVAIEGGYTAQEIARLSDELLEMSASGDRVRASASELASNLVQIADAGVTGVASLKLLEGASRLASATMSDQNAVVQLSLTLMKNLGLSVSEMGSVFDQLAASTLTGRVNLDEMAEGMDNLLIVSNELGIEFLDLLSAISVLTNAGMSTGEAMSALESIMIGLGRPTADTKKMLKELGMENLKATLTSQSFGEALLDLRNAADGSTEKLFRLTRSATAVEAIMVLTRDRGKELKETMQELSRATGTMGEMFRKSGGTLNEQTKVLLNSLQVLGIQAGMVVIPILTDFVRALQPIVTAFANMSPETQKTVLAVLAFVAVLGPAMSAVGRFFTALSQARTFIMGIPATFKVFKMAFMGLFTLVNAVASPIVIAILAIAAVVAFLVLAWRNNWFNIRGIVASAKDDLLKAFDAIKTGLANLWEKIKEGWNSLVTWLQTTWQTVSSVLGAAWQAFWTFVTTEAQTIWGAIKEGWNSLVTWLQTIWQTVSSVLGAAWQAFWTFVTTEAQTIWGAIREGWTFLLTALQTIWQTVAPVLGAAWQAFWTLITTVAQTIWELLKTLFRISLTTIQTIIQTTLAAIAGNWDAAWQAIKAGAEAIWEGIKSFFALILDNMVAIGGEKMQVLRSVILSALDFAGDVFNRGLALARRFGEGILAGLQAAYDAAKRIADAIRSLLPGSDAKRGPLADLFASGKALPETFAGGIARGLSAVAHVATQMSQIAMPSPGHPEHFANVLANYRSRFELTTPVAVQVATAESKIPQVPRQINVTINNPQPRAAAEDIYSKLQMLQAAGLI
jgi:TP901 family phage tail tape measure protein